MISAGPLRVLVVEDEIFIAVEIEHIVKELGYCWVGSAANSAGAIQLAEQMRPDLALVDVQLTDGPSGIHVARHLSGTSGIVVLFVTASRQHIPNDFAGACGVILKPYSEYGLRSALRYVEDCLANGRAAGPAPFGMSLSPTYAQRWGVAIQ